MTYTKHTENHSTGHFMHNADQWIIKHFDRGLLQGITLGAITFAIPVLWDTANEIRTALSQSSSGRDPQGILNKVYYRRVQKSFMKWVMSPSAFFAFLGLVIAPALSAPYNLILEILVILWFLLLVWTVSFMKKRNSRTIPEFVSEHDMGSKDYKELMGSIWPMTDFDIQEKLDVDIAEVFRLWADRVTEQIDTLDAGSVTDILKVFNSNLNNRSPLFMARVNNLFYRMLGLHYVFWHKEQDGKDEAKKNNATRSFEYDPLVLEVERSLEALLGRYIELKDTYEYFWALEKHTDEHIKDDDYLAYLYESIGTDIFDQTTKSDDRHSIWGNFPQSWRVTNDKLKDKSSGSMIAKFWNTLYLNWSRERLLRSTKDFDKSLETVTSYLFPTYDPPYFAKFLTYLMNTYLPSKELADQFSSHGISFGSGSHSFGGSFGIGEKAFKDMETAFVKNVKLQQDNAFKYYYEILNAQIDKKKLNGDIKELRKKSSDTEASEDQVRRANAWINFLEDIKQRMDAKKTKSTKKKV